MSKVDVDLSIRGIQEAQQNNIRRIAAVKPSGKLGKAIHEITITAFRFLVQITHVDTGSYKGSQRMDYKVEGGDAGGKLFVDPSTVNPRSSVKPVEYSVYEERRGGSHASYKRTEVYIEKLGLLRHGVKMVRSEL